MGRMKVGDVKTGGGHSTWRHHGHSIEVKSIEDLGRGDADVLWRCLDDDDTWRTSAPWTRAERESEDAPEG
jgi:hypothetical protein